MASDTVRSTLTQRCLEMSVTSHPLTRLRVAGKSSSSQCHCESMKYLVLALVLPSPGMKKSRKLWKGVEIFFG